MGAGQPKERVDLARIEEIRRRQKERAEHGIEAVDARVAASEVEDLLAALDATLLVGEKLRSYKAAWRTSMLADKLHMGRDRNDEAAIRHWEAKIAAFVCGDEGETFEDLVGDVRAERDRFETLVKEHQRALDSARFARMRDLLALGERVRKTCADAIRDAQTLHHQNHQDGRLLYPSEAIESVMQVDLAEALFGKEIVTAEDKRIANARYGKIGRDPIGPMLRVGDIPRMLDEALSDEVLAEIEVVVRPAPDIPGTWVAHFADFNCVTQGTSRLGALISLLDAARLMLLHLQPASACDMIALLSGRSEHAP